MAFVEGLAASIRERFPSCPAGRAEMIAEHAGLRGSRRVGRSAAGRALDPEAVHLAVLGSVRREDTDYDELLAGLPREAARDRVRNEVDAALRRWRARVAR